MKNTIKIKKELVEKMFQKKEEPKEAKPQKKIAPDNRWKPRGIPRVAIISLIFGIILLFAGTTVYFYRQYKKVIAKQNAAQATIPIGQEGMAKKELQSVVADVGKIMELPTGEDPILATVTDIEKVKNQKFFSNAQNGDKVLIYANNKKAILYRPSAGKIIEVSLVSSLGDNSDAVPADPAASARTGQDFSLAQPPAPDEQASAQSAEPSSAQNQSGKAVAVAVYNGTKTKGLAANIAETLSALSEVNVVSKSNAVSDYTDTVVIDLAGDNGGEAQKIADILHGSVGAMPASEERPGADILVIGGSE